MRIHLTGSLFVKCTQVYSIFCLLVWSLSSHLSNSALFVSFSFSGAKGGAQEIKESPEGSPSIHISVGVRENGTEEEREREKGEEDCESRLLLAADPAA